MSRSFARDAAVLVVGGLIGAGGLYAAQQGPSAVATQALSLYSGLMGGDGHAHAEAPKALAAADGHKEGDGHAHGKDGTHSKDDGHGHSKDDDHSKDDGHGHGSGKDDGHGHGKNDGHGHDKPKPKADAGAPIQVAAADDHKEGDGHGHGKEDAHSKDHGHGHGKDDAHSKDDGHGHGSGKDDGHEHGADDGHGHDKPKPKADAGGEPPLKVAAVDAKDDGHGHGAEKEDDGHGHGAQLPEGVVELGEAKVKAAGIALGKAGASTLREELQLNGIVQANQEAVVQVTPRFPGVVRTLSKRLGDQVKKGELLAVVESNQSLTTYELKAPMAGVITERQASLGEYVSEQKPAFVITDLSTLWVDFSVYRRDLAKVAVGETVRIDPEDGGEPIEAKISYLSPIGAADTQSAVARAVIANDGRFRPGLFATGAIATAEQSVPLAVSIDAVQSLEGRDVVFVREGDRFAARDVTLGRRDGRSVEVVTGLKRGEAYASRNSFVVKAELAKGSASHEH
ncbi:divalent metal ion exporter adaptor subunit IhpB [Chenggangzhangella methanolivorans]|uniref:divalent metal ion exporter adaptor subunit IhpB n=1 Tax=Chenggangzhangella methanolivorans TaxID=1437009 RepID=UPI003615DB2B